MFEESPSARADLKPGTLYAIHGQYDWIYYGQVTPAKSVGFFRRRDRQLAEATSILASPVMSVVAVMYPSITRALRSGRWKKLGRQTTVDALAVPWPSVQWPTGTLNVTVWLDGKPVRVTSVDDPSIQDMELIAGWDAEYHIPARLTADFGVEQAEWHVGGPIRRERRIKEEQALRFPGQTWAALPVDWVPTKAASVECNASGIAPTIHG
jgi:hypothetical protein